MICDRTSCANEARYHHPVEDRLTCGIHAAPEARRMDAEQTARRNPRSVLSDVATERRRQFALQAAGRFRDTPSDRAMPDVSRLASLVEEVGEVARALQELHGAVSDTHGADLRKELLQVAALAVAWVQHLDAETIRMADFHACVRSVASEIGPVAGVSLEPSIAILFEGGGTVAIGATLFDQPKEKWREALRLWLGSVRLLGAATGAASTR